MSYVFSGYERSLVFWIAKRCHFLSGALVAEAPR